MSKRSFDWCAPKPTPCPFSLPVLVAINPALADETTATSTVVRIQVVDRASVNYRFFHGALWLEYDKDKFNYRWGGLHCGKKGLSDLNVGLLFAAFRSKYGVTVDYRGGTDFARYRSFSWIDGTPAEDREAEGA